MLQFNRSTRVIYLDGTIGPQEYGCIDAGMVRDALSSLGKHAAITIEVNSPGGSLHTGLAIVDTLEKWPGTINTRVVGLAASAATDIYLCGKKRFAGPSSQIMVHQGWLVTVGNRSTHEDSIDLLLGSEEAMYTRYRSKLPATVSDSLIREWCAGNRDHYFTAWEAYDLGIVHHVEGQKPQPAAATTRGQEALARVAENQKIWAAQNRLFDAREQLRTAAERDYRGSSSAVGTALTREPSNLWIEDLQIQEETVRQRYLRENPEEAARLDRIQRLQSLNDAHYDRQMHFYGHTVKSGRPGVKPVRLDASRVFPR